ncbi:MAG: D-alanyl-D-alanine carboxypeptidase family protein [Clostridia bacterium]|nr:D-alanyl-D-alanine carboxypeptidase family protein [Clostridia bacterium]
MQNNARREINPIALFFIVFFGVSALICGIFALDFFSTDKRGSVKYVIGDEEYKLSGDDAYSQNGDILICFDDIATLCGMTVTGSSNSKVFYAENSNQKIKFSDDSRIAIINDSDKDMLSPAEMRGGKVYVPLDFVESYMGGIGVEIEKNTVTITRGEYNASTKDNPIYADATFTGGDDDPISPSTGDNGVSPTYTFVTDLSAFEQYMNPEDKDAFLILVNREKPIDENYAPSNLVDITNVRKDGRSEKMVETAEKALQALYIEMQAAGYTDVSVTSGYRSYKKQVSLYNTYTEREMSENNISREEAQKIVDTYSAKPGASEHQTGLCCDMHNLGSASQKFAEEEVYTWLIENCYKFGFVLRFPEGKEDITGYSFEPWHYRFVGRYHASEMHRLDMCLEEYIEYLDAQ